MSDIFPANSGYRELFSAVNANSQPSFKTLGTQQRLRWAQERYNGSLVLTSSFGIQSVIMLELTRQAGLQIPVVTVDIPGAEFDAQRRYRDLLQKHYGFDLHVFQACGEGDKVATMNAGLDTIKARAWLDGIRASQTKQRAAKGFITGKQGFAEIHPILDWPDARAEYFISNLPPGIIHPAFTPGVQSKGGRVLALGETKTECGLHTDDYQI